MYLFGCLLNDYRHSQLNLTAIPNKKIGRDISQRHDPESNHNQSFD